MISIVIDEDGKGRVTNFNLARMVDTGYNHVSMMIAGTFGYVAPE